MLEANAPPPIPERKAHAIRALNAQLASDKTITVIIIGMHNNRDVEYTTFLPPQTWVKNELEIRRVAPDKPAMPGKRKRMAWYCGMKRRIRSRRLNIIYI